MNDITANLAFAPARISGLYESLGVDFLQDADLADGVEPTGRADFVEWVEADDQRTEDEGGDPLGQADEILRQHGYRRVGAWDESLADYAQTRIEKICLGVDRGSYGD